MAGQFSATIDKLGINPCVQVPAQVSRAIAEKGAIPVSGSLNVARIGTSPLAGMARVHPPKEG
jgi:hypothetical protein